MTMVYAGMRHICVPYKVCVRWRMLHHTSSLPWEEWQGPKAQALDILIAQAAPMLACCVRTALNAFMSQDCAGFSVHSQS